MSSTPQIQQNVEERRIKSIFDVRDELHNKRKKIHFEQSDDTAKVELLTAYRSLVSSYLLEIEPLLEKFDDGKELLYDTEFGTVELQPTVNSNNEILLNGEWRQLRQSPPNKIKYELTGLESLYSVPSPIKMRTAIEVDKPGVRGKASQTAIYENKAEIEMITLDSMVRYMNQFICHIGLELDPEQNEESEFEYSDLV